MKMKLVSASVLAILLSAPVFAESPPVVVTPVDPSIIVPVDPLPPPIDPVPVVVVTPTLSDKAAAKALEFKAADADGDGFVVWSEFKAASDAKRDARILAAFTKADIIEKNGALSSDEFLNMFAVSDVVSPAAITQASTVFTIIDSNSDGVLSPLELGVASADEKPANVLMWAFARMDTNGDAKLAATEYGSKPAKLPKPPKLPKSKGSKNSPK